MSSPDQIQKKRKHWTDDFFKHLDAWGEEMRKAKARECFGKLKATRSAKPSLKQGGTAAIRELRDADL